MRLKNFDLILSLLLVMLNIGSALFLAQDPILNTILALPLVFFLPGYALTRVLFYNQTFSIPMYLMLGLGLSLTIDIGGGFILNLFPDGLTTLSLTLLPGSLTVVLCLLIAYLRARGMPRDVDTRTSRLQIPRLTLPNGILLVISLLLITFSITYAVNGATQQPYLGFTQLWLQPSSETGRSCTVNLGVRNLETQALMYRVTVTLNSTILNSWPAISLVPQQQWERSVSFSLKSSTKAYIEARLYRLDALQTEFQHVDLMLIHCGSPSFPVQHFRFS